MRVARVDVGYLEALGQPVVQGRNFDMGDLGEDRSAVIVNQGFVDRVLGGRYPLGRRLRYWAPGRAPGPWSYQIVSEIEPSALIQNAGALDQVPDPDRRVMTMATYLFVVLAGIAVVLSGSRA